MFMVTNLVMALAVKNAAVVIIKVIKSHCIDATNMSENSESLNMDKYFGKGNKNIPDAV